MNHDERLRKLPPREVCEHGSIKVKCPICELAEVEAENARLREALKPFANAVYRDNGDVTVYQSHVSISDWTRARDALGDK